MSEKEHTNRLVTHWAGAALYKEQDMSKELPAEVVCCICEREKLCFKRSGSGKPICIPCGLKKSMGGMLNVAAEMKLAELKLVEAIKKHRETTLRYNPDDMTRSDIELWASLPKE